jgi:hypothetical protein
MCRLGTEVVEIVTKRLEQFPINFWAIIITSMHQRGLALLPEVPKSILNVNFIVIGPQLTPIPSSIPSG